MAYLKVETIYAKNEAVDESMKVKVNVDVDGVFYCYVPENMLAAVKAVFGGMYDSRNDKLKVFANTFANLKTLLFKTLKLHITPEVTEEHVIRYNIESHVSFAVDDAGNIFPNAGYEGADWMHDEREKYGNHHACQAAPGGYGLTIGARAMTKLTYKYGDQKNVKYKEYYKGDHHLGTDNPAQLLNSWCSFSLPEDPKEIPYTDEAALFFHDMMLGMARLSQMIQSSTFDQSKLLELIESGGQLLLGSDKS